MNLPGVIIIGAQKCGTSSLHHYLNCHPEISMSVQKELNFFSEDAQWAKGVDWYKKQFAGKAKIYGEASPGYTMYPVRQGVVPKMHELVPDAKLIYLVRDPIDRMVSHYLDRVKGGREQREVSQALLDNSPDNHYFRYSQYYDQLSRFLEYYDRSAVYVETASRLRDNRLEALKSVFEFLDVDANFHCLEFDDLQNVSDVKLKRRKPRKIVRMLLLDKHSIYPKLKPWIRSFMSEQQQTKAINRLIPGTVIERPQLSKEVREQIMERLAPDLRQFRDLTGIDFIEHTTA